MFSYLDVDKNNVPKVLYARPCRRYSIAQLTLAHTGAPFSSN